MRSPSRGFCYCLPVRWGALAVSFFIFAGSISLASVTLHSLTSLSSHITSGQAAGHYLTAISWLSLTVFSLVGFTAALLQHPLILTVFARFLLYHVAINFVCNLVMVAVLFQSYPEADRILRSLQCTEPLPQLNSICEAFAFMERIAWLYLCILLPAVIVQTYGQVVVNRFIFIISGDWEAQREDAVEHQQESPSEAVSQIKRGRSVSQTIGRGGRRRAKALWFNMETPGGPGPDDSFLPSMIISPPQDRPTQDISSIPPVPPLPSGGLLSPVRSHSDLPHQPTKKVIPKASFTSMSVKSSETEWPGSSSLGFITSEAGPSSQSPTTAASILFTADTPRSAQPLLWSPRQADRLSAANLGH